MSVTTEKLAYLQGTKEEIRNAIIEKGVDVSTSDPFRSYAGSIRKISTGGVRSCRFVIGTSTAGWAEKDCDYLCDGVDDQVEINAAIQALPSTGGEIKVLDGTYNITSSINIDKEGVTFGGCGQITLFKRMWEGSSYRDAVISFSKSYCTFKDFAIDGNKSLYTSGSGLSSTEENLTDILIENIVFNNNADNGINLEYIQKSTIINNICVNNSASGFNSHCPKNSIFIENKCIGNTKYGVTVYMGQNCTVIGNICYDNEYGIMAATTKQNTITGNICNNNKFGIYADSSQNTAITGNACYDCDYGIRIVNAKNTLVTGNISIRGTGTSSDYTSTQHTIQLSTNTSNCIIIGNNCSGKAPTVAGTGNIVENNLS